MKILKAIKVNKIAQIIYLELKILKLRIKINFQTPFKETPPIKPDFLYLVNKALLKKIYLIKIKQVYLKFKLHLVNWIFFKIVVNQTYSAEAN